MPILGFTGLPGHGKSYGVVANVILPALKSGRTVVTNIPIDRVNMRKRLHAEGVRGPLQLLTVDLSRFKDGTDLTFAENIPHGAVVVLDEIWRIWPAGLKANNVEEDHKSFLAEHRHHVGTDGKTTEIVLVTQDLNQISAFARALIERTYVVHKLKEVGADDRYSVTIFSGVRSLGRGGQEIGTARGKFSSETWSLYKSHTKSDSVGLEVEADTRGTVWTSGVVRFGVPAAAVCFAFGAWSLLGVFRGFQGDIEPLAQAAETQSFALEVHPPDVDHAHEQRPPVAQHLAVEKMRLSEVWRIKGSIENEEGGFAYLVSDTGFRFVPLEDCELIFPVQIQYECVVDGERVNSWTGERTGRQLTFQPD